MRSIREQFNTVLVGDEKRYTMVPILKGELKKLGISKFLKDTLAMRNASAKSKGRHPGIWKELERMDFDPEALTLTKYLQRSLPRTRIGDPFRTETVVLEFSIPEENQSRTVTITGAHQTFSGEIPDMNDVSEYAKEKQRRFKKAIEAAMGNPQFTLDSNPHLDDDRHPLNWSSPAIPHWKI